MPTPTSPTSRRRSTNRPFQSPPITSKSPDSDRLPRGKRMKQEDIDPTVDTQALIVSSASSASNGRASTSSTSKAPKRKPKEKNQPDDSAPQPEDEENGGVTRCICGREDDPDAGEFMVQCEICKVWQHGLCMGYDSEAQLHDDDYYCEQCRPDFHSEYLSRPANAQRQSRSHSPSLLKQPSKRRNTMNSRDAAFDQNLKEILETTAAEAAIQDPAAAVVLELEEEAPPNRKKRKRNEEDAPAKKRTRSASTPKAAPKPGPRRRGGPRKVVVDGEEVIPAVAKRGGPRAKANKRTAAAPAAASNGHSVSGSAAYRNSHAYAVSQQPMFTSWNLPDYLSHLEQILPTDIPQPLEVPSGGPSSRGVSLERTIERGVKVKWPSKRMSVADMNKRVRTLVEWVGREQASASERNKRRQALELALQDEIARDLAENADHDTAPELEKIIPKYDDSQAINAVKLMEELMEELIRFQEAY
ncbi:hypothetical protein C8F01DRAFT_1243348 [Mycena amicta]|nr:hypothetical protein C8F01DRAFT_1243348 [Mycena amicta]